MDYGSYWGASWLRTATQRTIDTGYSARGVLFVLFLALFAIGVWAGSMILILIWGAATLGALVALVRAVRARSAERRLEERARLRS